LIAGFRVRAVLRKELLELASNRGLLVSLCALPAIMTAVPCLLALSYRWSPSDMNVEAVARYYRVYQRGVLPGASLVMATARQWLSLYLVTPMFLPVLIASQAVAGEKEKRTIEPLLASPATGVELLLGKSLAAVLPAVAITWLFFGVFSVAMNAIGYPLVHRVFVPDATWLFAMGVVAPLLALLGNALSVAISARLGDPRLTQQVAGLFVMPAVGLGVMQLVSLRALGLSGYAWVAVGVAVLDVIVIAVAARLFDRERILTRWN